MRVFRSLPDPGRFNSPTVVTIGNFDGVHCGHQMVLAAVQQRARELSAESIAVTFTPHPARVLHPEAPFQLITPLEQKISLLALNRIDHLIVLPFTEELRHWTARHFAETVLRDTLQAVEVHEGESFRFGHNAQADVASLSGLGIELGFAVRTYEPRIARGAAISSSRIRSLIAAGRMNEARALLGRPFSIFGKPASGRGYGTRYAVPTINLAPYADLLPAHGVYITTLTVGVERDAKHFHGVTNIGNRPTFGADSFAVETHLLDFEPVDLNEYTPLELTFLQRLRPERRFDSPEALRAQIGKDVAYAQRYFALGKALRGGPL